MLSLLFVAACGSSASGPRPLRYHVEERHVPSVPAEKRAEMVSTKKAFTEAQIERQKSKTELRGVKAELKKANGELRVAKRKESAASRERSSAEKSKDGVRINAAMRDKRVAELERRAAEKRVAEVKAKQEFQKKKLWAAEETMYAEEAYFELAKARVVRAQRNWPKKFSFERYQKQASDRSKKRQKAQEDVDKAKKSWDAAGSAYQAAREEADRAAGREPLQAGG